MKYKTLFRVLLKVIGVLIFVEGTSAVLTMVAQLSAYFVSRGSGLDILRWQITLSITPGLLKMAAGLYFFFGGAWLADKALPSNRPYCHECGYDLTNAAGTVCNECGTPFPNETLKRIHHSSDYEAVV
jgi:hypothetical protein